MASLKISLPSPAGDATLPWLCLDGIVCLQASQVACLQKVLPPSSSAWCWQALKFITAVVYCAEGGGGGLGRGNESDHSGERKNWPRKMLITRRE